MKHRFGCDGCGRRAHSDVNAASDVAQTRPMLVSDNKEPHDKGAKVSHFSGGLRINNAMPIAGKM